MRRCSYRSTLDRAVGLAGFTVDNLTATPRAQFNTKIVGRLKDGWEVAWWPELMRSQLRYYRDVWTATAFLSAAEVYHSGTGAYYRANLATTGADVPGVSSKWTLITDIDAYVSLDQTGLTPIGEVRGVYLDDPQTTDEPRRIPFVLGQNGIQVTGGTVPKSVYVWFRIRMPDFRGADFSPTTTYAAGVTRYYSDSSSADFEGDFWTTVATTLANEHPQSTPAKWTRLEFPLWLRDAVAHGAYADWLRLDGAGDLAIAEDGVAQGKLSSEVIKLAGQGQILRSRAA